MSAEARARVGARLGPGTTIAPENLPESVRQYITTPTKAMVQAAPEGPTTLSLGERIAGVSFGRRADEKVQARWAKLQLEIKTYNRVNPELRLQLPRTNHTPPPDFELCRELYWKYQHLRFDEDAANKVATLLTSFLKEHPREWEYSGWKNDAIAELVMGRLPCSAWKVKDRRNVAEIWLKQYWDLEQESERQVETSTSDTRLAASAALLELDMLEFSDEFGGPGAAEWKGVIEWLNSRWSRLPNGAKTSSTLFPTIHDVPREQITGLRLSDDDLSDICSAYIRIRSQNRKQRDAAPPSAVIQEVIARRHAVCSRVLGKLRASRNAGMSRSTKQRKKARK